jgi:hypothetical protein
MIHRRQAKFIHEGQYAAEVEVDLIETEVRMVSISISSRCRKIR